MNELAVSLDKNEKVATWTKDCPERIKPTERQVNPTYRGWYCCGMTTLDMAIASWKWNEERLGKPHSAPSIYIVTKEWIFPLEYEVPEDWEDLFSKKPAS